MISSSHRAIRFGIVATVIIIIILRLSSSEYTDDFDMSKYRASAKDGESGYQAPSIQVPEGFRPILKDQNGRELPPQQQQPQQQSPQGAVGHALDQDTTIDKYKGSLKGGSNKDDAKTSSAVAEQPYERANATFVTLARNSDLWDMVDSIRSVEDRFNHKFHYDWVFLNDDEFDDEFKKVTTALISGKTHYEKITPEHWSFPDWIDQDKAAKTRYDMNERGIIYGDSISYRHMCRFESGFFWREPIMNKYKWYWRVEPNIKLFCDIDYDVFKYMEKNNKKYGFTITIHEFVETIPTLWNVTKNFINKHPDYVAKDNLMGFLSEDGGETYNNCHYWSNFEIADMDFWRDRAYSEYFDYLDKEGGFFYERWGDAPVHSIAASLFLNKDQLHFFNDIGYWHMPYFSCPTLEEERLRLRCTCKPQDNFTWRDYSCTQQYYDAKKLERPKGWEYQSDHPPEEGSAQ